MSNKYQFGSLRDIWMVTRRGVEVHTSSSAQFFPSYAEAQKYCIEKAEREIEFAIYKCELLNLCVVDSPRFVDP